MQLSTTKKISLWLLPPEPIITTLTSIQSNLIAKLIEVGGRRDLPRFIPHVTLIGGVPISDCCSLDEVTSHESSQSNTDGSDDNIDTDEYAAQIVLRRMQNAFQSYGGIICDFNKEKGIFAVRNEDSNDNDTNIQWNQSCISIVQRSASFMNAMLVADDVLFATINGRNHNEQQQSLRLPIERHFKPPLYEPHYSFVYGNDANLIPPELKCPQSFTCTEMILMWTYPSTLEGVKVWKEIGRISLL